MKNHTFQLKVLVAICILLFGQELKAQQCVPIDTNDWMVLKALYQSTDGDNWAYSAGWEQIMSNTPPVVCNPSDGNDIYGVFFNFGANSARVSGLYLPFNGLSGNIPPELGNLNDLTGLWLDNNQLSGNIPPELGNLNNLTELWLYKNQLSGNIPPELGNLNNLAFLWLNNNQLSGNIPSELGNLNNLTFLRLNNNQLSGNIAPELGNLNNLTNLSLEYNQLSGCYDANLLNLCNSMTSVVITGNNFGTSWENFCSYGLGICAGCISDIIVNNVPIFDNIYQAEQTITSSGHVVSGSNVVFKSGQHIMLDNNFTVHPGGSLTIEIEDCN